MQHWVLNTVVIAKNKHQAKALKQIILILPWDMILSLLTTSATLKASKGAFATNKDSCASPAPECWYLTVLTLCPFATCKNNKVSLSCGCLAPAASRLFSAPPDFKQIHTTTKRVWVITFWPVSCSVGRAVGTFEEMPVWAHRRVNYPYTFPNSC